MYTTAVASGVPFWLTGNAVCLSQEAGQFGCFSNVRFGFQVPSGLVLPWCHRLPHRMATIINGLLANAQSTVDRYSAMCRLEPAALAGVQVFRERLVRAARVRILACCRSRAIVLFARCRAAQGR